MRTIACASSPCPVDVFTCCGILPLSSVPVDDAPFGLRSSGFAPLVSLPCSQRSLSCWLEKLLFYKQEVHLLRFQLKGTEIVLSEACSAHPTAISLCCMGLGRAHPICCSNHIATRSVALLVEVSGEGEHLCTVPPCQVDPDISTSNTSKAKPEACNSK